jgi:N utilization substance protein A
MNPIEIIRIVDSLHREKNIDPELVFIAIETAFATAARRQYGEERDVVVNIDRENGEIHATIDGDILDADEMIGRIGAQTAKQVIIQKIREAERDSLIEEYTAQLEDTVNGIVQRNDGPTITVSLGAVEAILPRSEQIPGESHHPNERIRAMICDVRPQGTRVKIVLTRSRPKFVQRLFEQEIPEVIDGIISINALAREPGHRSKVAVSSSDARVDCVGACVGVRGNRIKNIVDELSGERIDIVRWDEDPEILIPNALQPASVDQVLLCDMIGRAIVLVPEDQLSLAIGRRGQNVRLASKLSGWDIEIMTAEELDEQIDRAVIGFSALDGVEEGLAQNLVEQGYLSYDDLSVIEPDALMEMGGISEEQVNHIVEQAETFAEEAERVASQERILRREEQRAAEKLAREEAALAAEAADAEGAEQTDEEEQPAAEGKVTEEAAEGEQPAAEEEAAEEEQPAAEEEATEGEQPAAEEEATEEAAEEEQPAAEEEATEEAAEEEQPAAEEEAAEEAAEEEQPAAEEEATEEAAEEEQPAAEEEATEEAAEEEQPAAEEEATEEAAEEEQPAAEEEATEEAAGTEDKTNEELPG